MKENKKQLSVRVESSIISKIESSMKRTGLSKTEVVSRMLKKAPPFVIINGEGIAAELFRIRCLLEKNYIDEDIKTEIRRSLNDIKHAIAELFVKKGVYHGDFKGN